MPEECGNANLSMLAIIKRTIWVPKSGHAKGGSFLKRIFPIAERWFGCSTPPAYFSGSYDWQLRPKIILCGDADPLWLTSY
eukprot:s858_g29.t1